MYSRALLHFTYSYVCSFFIDINIIIISLFKIENIFRLQLTSQIIPARIRRAYYYNIIIIFNIFTMPQSMLQDEPDALLGWSLSSSCQCSLANNVCNPAKVRALRASSEECSSLMRQEMQF